MAVIDELESGDWAAMVLTGKPFVFCVGADVDEFSRIASRDEASEGSRAGHELFARIRALPYPTVAAVNGACLGGGLELALHCDARTIAANVRHVGFPEVALSIIPGWGGTQLTPKLAGPDAAVRLIVTNPLRQNRLIAAQEAVELGLADRLLEPVEFVDESLAFAAELVEQGGIERAGPDWSDAEAIFRKARARVEDALHGATRAPSVALDLIEGAGSWSLEEGYAAEEQAMGELMTSPQAQAAVYAFTVVERRSKKAGVPEGAKPRRDPEGRHRRRGADGDAARDPLPAPAAGAGRAPRHRAVARGRGARDDPRGGRREEPVPRDDRRRRHGLGAVRGLRPRPRGGVRGARGQARASSPRCGGSRRTRSSPRTRPRSRSRRWARTSASTSSTRSPSCPLVEVVRTPQTTDEVLATAFDVVKNLRKRGVLVGDAPAFVVNRVLTRMTTVLMDALEHGNTVEETDEAMLSLGLPMAPSVLLQMVGPRVANHVLETLHEAYPDRFPLSPTLAAYADGRDEIVVRGDARRSVDEIREAALEAVADEVRHLLDEGVVGEAADVDACLILGAGYPFHLGGITKHLDQTGVPSASPALTLGASGSAPERRALPGDARTSGSPLRAVPGRAQAPSQVSRLEAAE